MVIDTSALVAIVLLEPESETFATAIAAAAMPRMSVASWFETSTVIDGRGNAIARSRFDELVVELGIELVPVSAGQAVLARRAYTEFGEAGSHPARLNFGDCFAYALAKEAGAPLLFKGADFARTDIRPALA